MRNLLSLLLLLITISACDRGSAPLCVLADDFGDLVKREVHVKASDNGWINTGVTVQGGSPALQIQTVGTVELCLNPQSDITVSHTVDANINNWQEVPNITFPNQDEYRVSLTHSGQVAHNSGATPVTDGNGLWVYFGNMPVDPTVMYDASQTADPFSFELNDGGAVTLSVAEVPAAGNLYVRFDDHPGVLGWGDDSHYNDNNTNGAYTINVTRHVEKYCSGFAGEYLVAYIGSDPSTTYTQAVIEDAIINNTAIDGFINLHSYGGNSAANPGLYNDYGTVSGGTLWVRLVDSNVVPWNGVDTDGDADYTQAIFDSNGDYVSGSNDGEYILTISTTQDPSSLLGDILNDIVAPVKGFIFGNSSNQGLIEPFYKGLVTNPDFINAVHAALTLALIMYALTYVIGVNQISQDALIKFILRIALVITVTRPGSWEFFYENLFAFFTEGIDELINSMAGDFIGQVGSYTETTQTTQGTTTTTVVAGSSGSIGEDTFGFINRTLGRLLAQETHLKIAGLATVMPLGPILAIMIYIGIILFIISLGKAVLVYLISIIIVGILLFLAPIFITFVLFERTRGLFDTWFKTLIGTALQPVVMLGVLALFNVFIFSIMYMLLSFHVCWGCVFEVDLMISEALNAAGVTGVEGGVEFDQICLLYGYHPWGTDNGQSIGARLSATPAGIFYIMAFIILVVAMGKFVDWVVTVLSGITGKAPKLTDTAVGVTEQATASAGAAISGVKGTLGEGLSTGKQLYDAAKGKDSKKAGGRSGAKRKTRRSTIKTQ